MHRKRSPARLAPVALAVIVALAAGGCSRTGTAEPVDAPRALEALKAALDGWKRGDSPEKLKAASPSMTVQDMDWMAGAKLLSYKLADDGKEFGPNLNVPVDLVLRTKGGKEVKKSVAYVIGTSPIVTVFRAFR